MTCWHIHSGEVGINLLGKPRQARDGDASVTRPVCGAAMGVSGPTYYRDAVS
jgi:hypothetical protein